MDIIQTVRRPSLNPEFEDLMLTNACLEEELETLRRELELTRGQRDFWRREAHESMDRQMTRSVETVR